MGKANKKHSLRKSVFVYLANFLGQPCFDLLVNCTIYQGFCGKKKIPHFLQHKFDSLYVFIPICLGRGRPVDTVLPCERRRTMTRW